MKRRFLRTPAVLASLLWLAPAAALAETAEAPDPTLEPRVAEIMPLAPTSILLDVARAGDGYIAVGERGHILRSRDGQTWQQMQAPVRRMLNRLRFSDGQQGWAVGYDAAILETTNAGRTWEIRHFDPEAQPLYDLALLDGDRAIAVGGRGLVLRTEDGGKNWEPIENDVFDLQFHLFSITQLANGDLLITAEKGLLAHSEDEGRNWRMLAPAYTGSFFGALPYQDAGAVVFGLRGHVYVLEDAAAVDNENPLTWDEFEAQTVTDAEELRELGYRQVDSGTLQGLFGGTRLADGGYLLVGVNGVALRSDPAVTGFQALAYDNPSTLNQVLSNQDRALAVGRNGATWLSLKQGWRKLK